MSGEDKLKKFAEHVKDAPKWELEAELDNLRFKQIRAFASFTRVPHAVRGEPMATELYRQAMHAVEIMNPAAELIRYELNRRVLG